MSARQKGSETSGVCGNCGYIVRGLPTLLCPECGADLRVVGIVTKWRRPVGFWTAFAVWTVVSWFGGALISVLVASCLLPQLWTTTNSRLLQQPVSAQYEAVSMGVVTSVAEWPWRHPPASAVPEFARLYIAKTTGLFTTLNVEFGERLRGRYGPGESTCLASGLTRERVLNWMSSAGVDVGREDVQREADELFGLVLAIPEQELSKIPCTSFLRSSSGSMSTCSLVPWGLPAMGGFIAALWIIGILCLTRRYRARESNAEKTDRHQEPIR